MQKLFQDYFIFIVSDFLFSLNFQFSFFNDKYNYNINNDWHLYPPIPEDAKRDTKRCYLLL